MRKQRNRLPTMKLPPKCEVGAGYAEAAQPTTDDEIGTEALDSGILLTSRCPVQVHSFE